MKYAGIALTFLLITSQSTQAMDRVFLSASGWRSRALIVGAIVGVGALVWQAFGLRKLHKQLHEQQKNFMDFKVVIDVRDKERGIERMREIVALNAKHEEHERSIEQGKAGAWFKGFKLKGDGSDLSAAQVIDLLDARLGVVEIRSDENEKRTVRLDGQVEVLRSVQKKHAGQLNEFGEQLGEVKKVSQGLSALELQVTELQNAMKKEAVSASSEDEAGASGTGARGYEDRLARLEQAIAALSEKVNTREFARMKRVGSSGKRT